MYHRRITNLKIFEEINYLGTRYQVVQLYPYIAYLKNLNTEEVMCVSLGDLVIAGLEASLPPTKPQMYLY